MVKGLSPDIERKRPHKFTEKKNNDDVPINVMENMFNQQKETEVKEGFPATPGSVKLSTHGLLTQAFRVSLFIHDLLMVPTVDRQS